MSLKVANIQTISVYSNHTACFFVFSIGNPGHLCFVFFQGVGGGRDRVLSTLSYNWIDLINVPSEFGKSSSNFDPF